MRVRSGASETIWPSSSTRARGGSVAAVSSANSQLRLCASSTTV
jgi:hypothetical protein